MTAEEFIIKGIVDTIPEFKTKTGEDLMVFGKLMRLAAEYASQQRTEGIREGFEAARDVFRECSDGCEREHTYFDVEDYLSTKR